MGLTLSGKKGEKFFIGDDIVIKIIKISEGIVRLDFEAPPNIEIDREKIRELKNGDKI